MPNVRGIGVAVSVSTSTSERIALMASLWRTPKRCSSSITSRPRRLNSTSLLSSLCVPTTMSMLPSVRPASAALVSLPVRKRDSSATLTGHLPKRSLMVWKCCSASSVVGASSATCLPPSTAMNAARSATSVLPKPTSPHTRRSIGFGLTMSWITAWIAARWSGVSSKPKPAANAS